MRDYANIVMRAFIAMGVAGVACGQAPKLPFGSSQAPKLPSVINVKTDFGAKGDNATDDSAPVQAALDYVALRGGGTLFFPSGTFRLHRPLILGTKRSDNRGWNPTSGVTLKGASDEGTDSGGTVLRIMYTNGPALAIQQCKHIAVEGLSFEGRGPVFWDVASLFWETNFLGGGIRTNRYSPYAGICIDPFDAAIDAADRYPTLSADYVSTAMGGSGHIRIQGCHIRGFYVGVMNNPSPSIQNGETIVLDHCQIANCHTGFAAGQSQSRDNAILDCSMSSLWEALNTHRFGQRKGTCPNVYRGEITFTRYLFEPNTAWGQSFIVSGLYTESIGSLGVLHSGSADQSPIVFLGCTFNFQDENTVLQQAHLGVQNKVRFISCSFYSPNAPILIATRNSTPGTKVSFDSCEFRSGGFYDRHVYRDNCLYLNNWAQAEFHECKVGGTTTFSQIQTASSLSGLNGLSVVPNSIVRVGTEVFLVGGDYSFHVHPRNYALNAGRNGGTFTVTADMASRLLPGDKLCQEGSISWLPSQNWEAGYGAMYCGTISSVNGTTVVVTNSPPNAFTNAALVRIQPKWHEPTTGDLAVGKLTVSNMSAIAAWTVGDRIRGTGIMDGTYVVATNRTTITLSRAATTGGRGVALYDAPLARMSGSSAVNTVPIKLGFSTNYQCTLADAVLLCTGTNQLITLLDATTTPPGKWVEIVAANLTGSVIVTQANAGQALNRPRARTIKGSNKLRLYSDGANWW